MPLLLDTGILYAYYDRDDRWHAASSRLLTSEPGELLVPSAAIPEVDHLLGGRLGAEARRAFYSGLREASYLMVELPQEKIARLAEIDLQFDDLDLGFVDCSIVALTETLGVSRIATTDRRHLEPIARVFDLELLPELPPA